jgi:tRNA-dependent cyclodipeptide synthase
MPQAEVMTKAFVGISLDSKSFSRAWVRGALSLLASKHQQVLMVFADELFVYTRAAHPSNGRTRLELTKARAAAAALADERMRFFRREVDRLGAASAANFRLAHWRDFSDDVYATLWRQLWLAYSTLDEFRRQVDHVAIKHTAKAIQGDQTPNHARVSAAYILDEIAMCIRVTEVEGFASEYHPSADLPVATALYAGEFAADGLSVQELTGKPPHRTFTILHESAMMPAVT